MVKELKTRKSNHQLVIEDQKKAILRRASAQLDTLENLIRDIRKCVDDQWGFPIYVDDLASTARMITYLATNFKTLREIELLATTNSSDGSLKTKKGARAR